jgi:hypothetical protein
MLKSLCVAVALVVVGCAGSNKKADKAPMTTAAAPADANVKLALGEMRLVDVAKNQAINIHADGTIEFNGKVIVKVTPDGKLVKIDTGEVGLSLQPDGSINGPNGEVLEVKLGNDGTLVAGDKTLSVDSAGMLVGGNPGAPELRVEGATDAKLKRTAMFVLVAVAMPSSPPEQSASEAGPKTTPTPTP